LQSLTWYLRAAQQGRKEAQYTLGKWYAMGSNGVARDLQTAAKWFGEASAQGDDDALRALRLTEKAMKDMGEVPGLTQENLALHSVPELDDAELDLN